MKITKTRLEQIIKEELKRYKETATEAIFDSNEFKVIYREVQGSLQENPAAMAAAAMAATQLRNQQGKQIKATTALNDKSHAQHDKAKSMFQRLKDKFSSKEESVVNETVYQFKKYTNTQMDKLDALLSRAGYKGKPDFNKMTWTTKDKNSKIEKIIKSKGGKKIKESVNEALNESLNAKFEVHSDPDKTEKSFVAAFKELAKGHGSVIDYGPRESDMYDWNSKSHYAAAIKEYNAYMKKIAVRLNSTAHDMNNIYKVWGKISDKHRKQDRVNETKESVSVTRSELKELVGEVIKEGNFEKLGVPVDRVSKVRLLAIMKKLRIPLAGPTVKVGYTLSQKGNKGILTVPSKYFDDVIEQMIKMNISVHSA